MAAAGHNVMEVEDAVDDPAEVLLQHKVPSLSMLNDKEVRMMRARILETDVGTKRVHCLYVVLALFTASHAAYKYMRPLSAKKTFRFPEALPLYPPSHPPSLPPSLPPSIRLPLVASPGTPTSREADHPGFLAPAQMLRGIASEREGGRL
jgi:hypothetical protein